MAGDASCMNNLTFWDFRPVFDQKLEMAMGCSQKTESAPVGTSPFSMIPRRAWLISGPKLILIPKNRTLGRCKGGRSLFGQSLGPQA
jgi:hypothetical protein